jgi:hypothetical protein
VAVARDALLVADRLRHRLAERDADVLDRVVAVDVQVARGLDLEVDQPVAGDLVEHVVEEADAGGELGRAAAVEVDAHADLRLGGVAPDFGDAVGGVHRGQARSFSAARRSGACSRRACPP